MQKEADRIVTSKELSEEFANLPKQNGYSTGYKQLDYYLRHVAEGDLIILTGNTGEGKSAFGVSLTKNFLEQQLGCLWFSFELSGQELLERFSEKPTNMPIFHLPRIISSKSADWIEKKIVEGIKFHNTKVVFIDHLHYLTDDATVRNKNLPEILGDLCRRFKMIARKYRVIVFLLAHVRKVSQSTKKGVVNRPTLDDLAGSAAIGQEADTVLVIQRIGKKRSKKIDIDEIAELSTDVKVYIDKNRRLGRLGSITMMFDVDEKVHKEYETLEDIEL